MCFSVIVGVNNTAALGKEQNHNYLEAVNMASSTMDEILNNLEQNASYTSSYFGQSRQDQIGNFNRTIKIEWHSADLLLITVHIQWLDRGNLEDYLLESLFYVHQTG